MGKFEHEFEHEWNRLVELKNLWWAGALPLATIALVMLGAKSFYDIFSQAYGLYLLLLGLLVFPIMFALFVMGKKPGVA